MRLHSIRTLVSLSVLALAVVAVGCTTDDDGSGSTDGDDGISDLDIPDHECAYDSQCAGTFSDLDPCEKAVCEGGACVKAAQPQWAACDHPDAQADECEAGACNAGGQCIVVTALDGLPCEESSWTECVVGECKAGECADVPTVNCDDDNPCTDDSCNTATGDCDNDPNTEGCDDGNPCTGGDACTDGVCFGTDNTCQCSADSDCDSYDDGDKCNGVMVCVDKLCVPLEDSEVTCDALEGDNPCVANLCNSETGACEVTESEPYLECDDGDPCTGCGPDDADCGQHDFCTDGECKPGLGAPCDCTTGEECMAFDDGDLCNGTWNCMDGTCAADPATVVDCSDQTAPECQVLACQPDTGTCDAADAEDGVACSGNPCDFDNFCSGGVCSGSPKDCDDGDPCTADSCDEITGECVNESVDCDDSDACTTDSCNAADGTCDNAPGAVDCNDGDACTTDSCNPADGTCDNAPGAVDCGDDDNCTDDVCDGATGGCSNPAVDCNDDDACTADACSAIDGTCSNTPDVDCNDDDACTVDSCNAVDGTCDNVIDCQADGCDAHPDCQS